MQTSHAGIFTRSLGDREFTGKVNNALARIASRPHGQQLLQKLAKAVDLGKGKMVVIRPLGQNNTPITRAYLTANQARKLRPQTTVDDNNMAIDRAQKKPFLGIIPRKGPGTMAEIRWDPEQRLELDADGIPDPTLVPDPRGDQSFTDLAHELVHAKHVMAGNLKYGGDPSDTTTPSGQEEIRAMRHENLVRAEHGLPHRSQYATASESDESPQTSEGINLSSIEDLE